MIGQEMLNAIIATEEVIMLGIAKAEEDLDLQEETIEIEEEEEGAEVDQEKVETGEEEDLQKTAGQGLNLETTEVGEIDMMIAEVTDMKEVDADEEILVQEIGMKEITTETAGPLTILEAATEETEIDLEKREVKFHIKILLEIINWRHQTFKSKTRTKSRTEKIK